MFGVLADVAIIRELYVHTIHNVHEIVDGNGSAAWNYIIPCCMGYEILHAHTSVFFLYLVIAVSTII